MYWEKRIDTCSHQLLEVYNGKDRLSKVCVCIRPPESGRVLLLLQERHVCIYITKIVYRESSFLNEILYSCC